MLKGVEKFKRKLLSNSKFKRKDQLKSKDDVPVIEAFELYMLKNFFDIKLNSLSSQILNFWEKDFDISIKKHLSFLKENLEDQNIYGSKF